VVSDVQSAQQPIPNEEWRFVPDFDGMYEVSNLGSVRRTQTTLSDKPFPPMTPQRSSGGRGFSLGLRHKGRTRQVSLERLVGRVFLGFPKKTGIVYWKDGDHTNNAVSNLAWAARHEDMPAHLHELLDSIVLPGTHGVEWRPVVGYEGIYDVSADGEVRRIIPGRRGRSGRLLRPRPGRLGYVSVTLTKNGWPKQVPVHRIVAEAFLPLPAGSRVEDLVVHHVAEPKSDNRVENLRWATHGQNMEYAVVEAADRRLRGEPPRTSRYEFPPVTPDATWKTLTSFGLCGRFEVSSYGHIRRRLPGRGTFVGKLMVGRLTPLGYVQVKMRIPGTKHGVIKTVHILVASAFLPPPSPEQTVIDHKNGDKTDNRVENLEWVTQAENTRRAVAAGRFHHDGRHVAAVLSLADVEDLRRTAGERTRAEHAARYGVTPSAIDDALSGRTHAGVTTAANGKPIPALRRGESHPRSKLTADAVRDIVKRREAGESVHTIAADHGIEPATIYQIMRGMIWHHVTGIDRDDVGFRESQEDFFKAGLAACTEWCQRHGSLANVKVEDDLDGFPIGAWVDRRRCEYRKGELSCARRDLLEGMGVIWNPHEDKWQRGLAAARLWVEQYGNLGNVPVTAVIDGFALGRWLATRRVERNASNLDQDRIETLTALGMNWRPRRGPKSAR
jgi:hypothetical protein